MVKAGSSNPDPDLACDIVRRSMEQGLLMFSPVGYGGASVKISPPLVIQEEPLREGLAVIEKVLEELLVSN